MEKTQRLNKVLAASGVASRRKADEMIVQGRITVNGDAVKKPGCRVNLASDTVRVDGIPLNKARGRKLYFLLNKPKGVVTTASDPEGRKTVMDFVPSSKGRLFPVGRLDYDADGVILLTNDGEMTHRLTHPRFGVVRTYLAKVKGRPSDAVLAKLRRGVRLEDGFVKPLELRFERATRLHSWYRVSVREGRNHLIKRLWLRVDHPLLKLTRTEFAGLRTDGLRRGQCRPLKPGEIKRLMALAGPTLKKPTSRSR